ncbi:MAG: NTP transferase domain-containing protein, partial [Euryarchaeota archaeon]|nr:NTP transferase domain-containing protein [Euryarchaeota archaeon]
MDAVVMAGGMGRRLGNDEKPLTLLLGKPLISYVLCALLGSRNIRHIRNQGFAEKQGERFFI